MTISWPLPFNTIFLLIMNVIKISVDRPIMFNKGTINFLASLVPI